MKIALIGSGSWATEIERLIREHDVEVVWWRRRDEAPIKDAICSSDYVLLAVPSPFIYKLLSPLDRHIFDGKSIISAVKGFLPETHQSVTSFLKEHFAVTDDRLCVIGGPSHAEEVSRGQMAALTVASSNRELTRKVCTMFRSNTMRCTPSNDVHRL